MTDQPTDEQAIEFNRVHWEERVDAHFSSPMYQAHLSVLRDGGQCLEQVHVERMGSVAGQSLLHLQCHMGMETLSWQRLGARVTGLDYSAAAIDRAQTLAAQLDIPARFVCANVYDTPAVIDEQFDVVFVSVGAICWLPDIERWAKVVGKVLKPGGRLYMDEVHPFTDTLDDHPSEPTLVVTYPYFHNDGLVFNEGGSYADPDGEFEHNTTVNWTHPLGTVINGLIGAGLAIDALHESADCGWPRYKIMRKIDPNHLELPGAMSRALPMTYTLLAHKQ